MALKDLALAADGDLFINETGDFEIIDAVRQGVQIRLRWIKENGCSIPPWARLTLKQSL